MKEKNCQDCAFWHHVRGKDGKCGLSAEPRKVTEECDICLHPYEHAALEVHWIDQVPASVLSTLPDYMQKGIENSAKENAKLWLLVFRISSPTSERTSCCPVVPAEFSRVLRSICVSRPDAKITFVNARMLIQVVNQNHSVG